MAWKQQNAWEAPVYPAVDHNLVRNSGFWFAQRQSPPTPTTYNNANGRSFTADGWAVTNENASVLFARVGTIDAPEAGLRSNSYGQFTKTASTGKIAISQVVESIDTAPVRGRTVRLQCYMKQVVGSGPVMRLGLAQLTSSGTLDVMPASFLPALGSNGTDPTVGANLARLTPKSGYQGDNCTVSGNAADCVLSAVWQRYGVTFDVPADAKNLVVMVWGNAQFVANAGFAISQVSVTDGADIREWMPNSYDRELARCQRYYQKTFGVHAGPANNAGLNTGEWRFPAPKAGTAAAVSPSFLFPVPMRIAPPTRTAYNPAAANSQVRDISVNADCTVQAFGGVTDRGCYVTFNGAGGTAVGDSMGLHMTFDAEL